MTEKKAREELAKEVKLSSLPVEDPFGITALLVRYRIRYEILKRKYDDLKFRMDGLER